MERQQRLDTLYRLDRYEQLLAEAGAVVGDDQEAVTASLYRILALEGQKRWQDAWVVCRQVRATCAAVPLYWVLSARVLRLLERLDEAIACIDKALGIDLEVEGGFCEKALLLWFKGDIAGAKRCFDQSLARHPTDAWSLCCLAGFYSDETVIARPDLGSTILRNVLAREPHNEMAHELLAHTEVRPWRKKDLYRRLLALNPLNRHAQEQVRRFGSRQVRLMLLAAFFCSAALLLRLEPNLLAKIFPVVVGLAFILAIALASVNRLWPLGFMMVLLPVMALEGDAPLLPELVGGLVQGFFYGLVATVCYLVGLRFYQFMKDTRLFGRVRKSGGKYGR